MVARTLTQHAVPTTFGTRAATWLNGVVDAAAQLAALDIPAQIGVAGGTLSATTELATLLAGRDSPAQVSVQLLQSTAAVLGLAVRRAAITALALAATLHTAAAELVETDSSPTYFGAVDALIDASLDRARRVLKENR